MTTFQVSIYTNGPNTTASAAPVGPAIAFFQKDTIQIPFINNRRVKVLSIDAYHSDVNELATPLLCVMKSEQLYNQCGGSHDILFTSYGCTYYDDIYINNDIKNNQFITIRIENVQATRGPAFITNFAYFLLTLKIEN